MSAKKGFKYEEETELRRGPWTLEEDTLLIHYIACHGEGRWNLLARCSGLKRTGKSCRLRWLNYLKPDVKRGNLTPEEQILILDLHSKWGNKWSRIAQHLPGRTDNEIKNYWRTRVQKQARQLKIDANSTLFRDAVRRFWMSRPTERMGPSPAQPLVDQSTNINIDPTVADHSMLRPPVVPHPMVLPAEPALPSAPTGRCSSSASNNDVVYSGLLQPDNQQEYCSPSISLAGAPTSSYLLESARPDRRHYAGDYGVQPLPMGDGGGDDCLEGLAYRGLDVDGLALGGVGSSSASDCSMMMEDEYCMGSVGGNTSDSLWSIFMGCGGGNPGSYISGESRA